MTAGNILNSKIKCVSMQPLANITYSSQLTVF